MIFRIILIADLYHNKTVWFNIFAETVIVYFFQDSLMNESKKNTYFVTFVIY